MSGLNRIDFPTSRKVDAVDPEVSFFSDHMKFKFDPAISRGMDQVHPCVFSQP